jgi:short-subunit dehydrogenase
VKVFANKVAVITGAGSGIGRALALELARRGCHLALCDVNEASLRATALEAQELGVRVSHAMIDVADRAQMHAWAERVAAEHGGVNLVVNNAGVSLMTSIAGADYEDLAWIMGINFWGVVHGTKAFLPHLMASGDGHIVNISSVFGLGACPSQGGYNAAKFAVRGFTECLRAELDMVRSGVSATCVYPGGIRTNIARAARVHPSVTALGMDENDDGSNFERMARTSPEKAAKVILRGVAKNKRRVLIGADARIIDWIIRLFPAQYQHVAILVARMGIKRGPAEDAR